jgi:hypothetical protein
MTTTFRLCQVEGGTGTVDSRSNYDHIGSVGEMCAHIFLFFWPSDLLAERRLMRYYYYC